MRARAARAAAGANKRAKRDRVIGRLAIPDILDLWQRQPVCVHCGRGRGVDHIVPTSLGGSNTPDNIQNLCHPCNARKGNGLPRGPRSGICRRGLHDLNVDGYTNARGQRSCRRCANDRKVLSLRRRNPEWRPRKAIDPRIAIRVGRRP